MLACTKAVASNADMRATLVKVGVEGRKIIEKEVRKDFGADLAMSNWRRRKPVKLRVGFEVPKDSLLEFNPKPAGIWQVAEQGRRSGSRPPRRRRGSGRRGPSSWGPSKGKRTWSRSQRELVAKTPETFRRIQRKRVVDAFMKG
jgi:hypothetical protein